MGKCINEEILGLTTMNPLTNDTYITIDVTRKINPCNRINTKNVVFKDVDAEVDFNDWLRPQNAIECMRTNCGTTGTLTMKVADKAVAFRHNQDGKAFVGGVITMYIKSPSTQTLEVMVTSDDPSLVGATPNGNIYEITTNDASSPTDVNGFEFAMISLGRTPDDVSGTGWAPSEKGTYIVVTPKVANTQISTIDLFHKVSDLANNDTVKLGCTNEVALEIAMAATESTCLNSTYSKDRPQLDISVTVNSVTPNYWKLNPMMGEGEKAYSGKPSVFKHVVETYTHPIVGEVGLITIADVYQDDCGYIRAHLDDECIKDADQLEKLSVPVADRLLPNQYLVQFDYETGLTYFVFAKELIGKKIEIQYNQKVEVKDLVGNMENVGETDYRMTIPVTWENGRHELLKFDNLLTISFPMGISKEENSFQVQFRLLADRDGNFYRKQQILGDN